MKGVRAVPRGAEGRLPVVRVLPLRQAEGERGAGMNCIKIDLPGKLFLSNIKGLREVLFS